uniref:G-protein coupled receptors family 1 profile domain-containing protein n=1 Tax=Anopheles dirus TaxID=7168 RepID=A0A182N0A9_9DIPT
MNESECASLLASVQWTDPTNLVSLAVLAFINVLVIVGNCLVIAAVLCSHKLRSLVCSGMEDVIRIASVVVNALLVRENE